MSYTIWPRAGPALGPSCSAVIVDIDSLLLFWFMAVLPGNR